MILQDLYFRMIRFVTMWKRKWLKLKKGIGGSMSFIDTKKNKPDRMILYLRIFSIYYATF